MSPWPMLALITLAQGLGALTALSVAPLAPFLLDALGLSRFQAGLFLPAIYLGGVLMSLPAGWLADRLGVRFTLGLGQLLTGTMVVLAALAGGFPALLAFLVVGGFGFSVLNPTTGKAIVEWFPPRRRGMAMGVKQTGLTLGGLAAALLLPPLALATSWRHALATAGA
ncbi:MAG: MFS transporter, partial [candidate division NC10 bacterium]